MTAERSNIRNAKFGPVQNITEHKLLTCSVQDRRNGETIGAIAVKMARETQCPEPWTSTL